MIDCSAGITAISGLVSGSGKIGNSASGGTLILTNDSNSFTNSIAVYNGGTITCSSFRNTGVNSALGAGAGRITMGTTAGGGTINYIGAGDINNRGFIAGNQSGATNGGPLATILNNGTNGGTGLRFTGAGGSGPITCSSATNGQGTLVHLIQIGGSNTDANEFFCPIQDLNTTSIVAVVKSGGGVWRLSGTNTYTGPTTINGGTLYVNSPGSIVASPTFNYQTTVNSGGTLAGNGTISNAVTVNAGGYLAPGNATNVTGTLTLANNLTLNGGSLNFNLTQPGVAGGCNLIAVGGTTVVAANSIVQLVATTGTLTNGNYTLITYPAKSGSGLMTFPNGLTNLTVGGSTLTLTNGATSLVLNVSGGDVTAPFITWKGNVNGTWDITGTANWNNGAAVTYAEGNQVTFDDTAANFTLTNSSPVTVNPGSVTFNNSINNYIISSNIAIAGSTPLAVNGSAFVTLAGTNTYSGGTTLNAGELSVGAYTNLSANGPLTFNGGALQVTGTAITNLNSYTVNWSSFNGSLDVASSVNTLTVTNPIGGGGSLTKLGAGTLTLSNANTYTGATTISTGTLNIGGAGQLGGGSYSANLLDNGMFGYFSTAAQTISGGISGTGSLTNNGPLTLTGVNTFTGPIGNGAGGVLTIGGAGMLGGGNYATNIINNGALVYASTAAQTNSGAISGSGSLTNNAGSLTLSYATNTFTGNVVINAGTVTPTASGGTGGNTAYGSMGNPQVARSIIVNSGATLNYGTSDILGGIASTTIAVTNVINGGTVSDVGVGTVVVTLGPVTLNGGTMVAGTGNATGDAFRFKTNVTVTGSSPSTLTSVGGINSTYGLGAAITFNVADVTASAAPDLIVAAPLSLGGGNLIKAGLGTMLLYSNNIMTNTITISNGVLVGVVGGSCSNSAVIVSNLSGATLGVQVTDNTKQWTCTNLTFAGTNATLQIDASYVIPSASVAPLRVLNNVTNTSPGNTNQLTILAGNMPTGVYPLIVWGGTNSIPSNNWALTLPHGVTGSLSNNFTTKTLYLIAANSGVEPLTWGATSSTTWDTSTVNWTNGLGANVAYSETPMPGDQVVFNDNASGAGPLTVTLNTTVTPASVTVSNVAKNYTISGTGGITGGTTLTKSGTGILAIATANTYTGGTTNSGAGILQADNSNALGTGLLTMNGGTLSNNVAGVTLANAVNLAANATVGVPVGNNLILGGVITNAGALTVSGGGTLTLSNANTYSGPTTLSGSTLVAANALAIGTNLLTLAGGTLSNTVSSTLTNMVNLTSSSTVGIPNGVTVTLNSPVTNSGALTKSGAGSLTLNPSLSKSVTTTNASTTVAMTDTTGVQVGMVISGNTITAGTYITAVSANASVTISASPTVPTTSSNITATITGNTYAGGTTVTGGTLSLSTSSTLNGTAVASGATGTGNVTLGGNSSINPGFGFNWYAPTLYLNGTVNLIGVNRLRVGFNTIDLGNGTRTLNVNGKSLIATNGFTLVSSGEATGQSQWETLAGPSGSYPTITNGVLDLETTAFSGTNYGAIAFASINGWNNASLIIGTNVLLQMNSNGNINGPAMTINTNGIFDMCHFAETVASLADGVNGGGAVFNSMLSASATAATLTINGTTGTTTFSGTINNGPGTGALAVSKTGASTQTLAGVNTHSGGTTVSAGTLIAKNASALGTTAGQVTVSGGTLTLSTPASVNAYNITMGGGTLNLDPGTSTAGFTHTLGTLTLGTASTLMVPFTAANFSSPPTISFTSMNGGPNNGVDNPTIAPTNVNLSIGGITPIASSSGVHAFNYKLDGISTGNQITGTIQDNVTTPGTTASTVAITKQNTSTWTLSGANTYSGTTTVSGGTLLVNGSLTSLVTNQSGATFGGTGTISNNVSLAAGAKLWFTNGPTLTVISNLVLNGNNIYLNFSNNVPTGTYVLATAYGSLTGSLGTMTVNSGTAANGTSLGSLTPRIANGTNIVLTIPQLTPTATLAVNNSPVTYNGLAQAAVVVTNSSSVPGTVNGIQYSNAVYALSSAAPTNAGTYAVYANFVPTDSVDYNTLTGLAAGNFVINKAGTAVAVGSLAPTNGYHDAVYFTATVTNVNAGNTVTFLTNGTALSTSNLVSGVAISLTITSLPRGTNIITAQYAGDGNYLGSTNTLNQYVTNHPPVAAVMTVVGTKGVDLAIALSDVATNWTDADGDPISLTRVTLTTTNGLVLSASNWVYQTNGSLVSIVTTNSWSNIFYPGGPSVADQISYSINDGQGGTNIGYINIVVDTNPVVGTNSIASYNFTNGVPFTLTAYGVIGQTYIAQRSTNLTSWVNIATNVVNTNGVINVSDSFIDLGSNAPSPLFYRLMWQAP